MNDLLFHQEIQSQRGTRYKGKEAEKKGMLIWKVHWAAENDCVQCIGHPLKAVYTAAQTSPRMKWAKEGEFIQAPRGHLRMVRSMAWVPRGSSQKPWVGDEKYIGAKLVRAHAEPTRVEEARRL